MTARSSRFKFSIFSICAGMVLWVSCGPSMEHSVEQATEKKAAEEGQNVEADLQSSNDGVQMTFMDDDGQETKWELSKSEESMKWHAKDKDGTNQVVIGQNAELPTAFPDDIPLYPEMTILMTHAGSQNARYSVRGISPEPMHKVSVFFAEATAQNGWSPHPELGEMNMGALQQRLYQKDSRTLHLTLITNEGETMITVNTQENR